MQQLGEEIFATITKNLLLLQVSDNEDLFTVVTCVDIER